MKNYEALLTINYGLYLVCSGDKNHGNGFVSNTVFQVTSNPPQIASCCNKENYTKNLIEKCSAFTISVLHQKVSPKILGSFGFRSGKEHDKLKGLDIDYGITGAPIVKNDSVSYLECKLVNSFDAGTHLIFIGEMVAAGILDSSGIPMSYEYYRKVKKGIAPPKAPTFIDSSLLHREKD